MSLSSLLPLCLDIVAMAASRMMEVVPYIAPDWAANLKVTDLISAGMDISCLEAIPNSDC